MLVHENPSIAKEVALMQKLRDELKIMCVPRVYSMQALDLADEKDWHKKICHDPRVNPKLRSALQKSINTNESIESEIKEIKKYFVRMKQGLQEQQEATKPNHALIAAYKTEIHKIKTHLTDLHKFQIENTSYYMEEENVGVDLYRIMTDYDKLKEVDYFTTSYNLLLLLRDVRKMISHDHRIFNCDIKAQNLTCKLEFNELTQQSSLRFYVIDWGFGEQLNDNTKVPTFLKNFFQDSQFTTDWRLQIPDEFVACFMCFRLCLTDKQKSIQQLLKHISMNPLNEIFQEMEQYDMFCRFNTTTPKRDEMWRSIQAFMQELLSPSDTNWVETLSQLRWKDNTKQTESFMVFMVDFIMHRDKINSRPEALLKMMQRVECWSYGCALWGFWNFLSVNYKKQKALSQPKVGNLLEQIRELLKHLISNEQSFATLEMVIKKMEEYLEV